MKDGMNWKALKENMCPMCRGILEIRGSLLCCADCEFKINKEKAESIVNDMIEKEHGSARYESDEVYSGEIMTDDEIGDIEDDD